MNEVSATQATSADDNSPSARELDREHPVLRNGDLVRVSEVGIQRAKRLKDREGQLGRIVIETPSSETALYTVEFILGGKLKKVLREELAYTTAQAEGMTEGDLRNRRKRKPTDFMQEVAEQDAAKKLKRKEYTKEKTPSPKAQSAPKATKEKAKSKAAKKPVKKAAPHKKKKLVKKPKATSAAKKNAPVKKKAAANGKEQAPKKKKAPPPAAAAPEPAAVMDLYERHRREFERILTRLEKVDKFGYFFDDAPPEFDETLPRQVQNGGNPPVEATGSVETDVQPSTPTAVPLSSAGTTSVSVASAGTTSDNVAKEGGVDMLTNGASLKRSEEIDDVTSAATALLSAAKDPSSATPKEGTFNTSGMKEAPEFPSYPPFNWKMVRRRMELGRYVLDREKGEEEQRFIELGPYYNSLGRKRPRRKYTGTGVQGIKKSAAKENYRVLYPKGVDWDQFRDDVLGMCDGAIERDSSAEPDSKTSLTTAAKKIKEAVLQACERTGSRHMEELLVADDRFKFGTAIEKHKNTEAAMQSWRKEPFPERRYERLSADKVCDGLSELDERVAIYERKTSLPDSFVGISYRYDDTGQSEAWMKSVVDETGSNSEEKDEARQAALALAADDGVTRAQVVATMQTLLIGVKDRVMTDTNVLNQPELRSANWEENESDRKAKFTAEVPEASSSPQNVSSSNESPEIVEQPVWGIDCYTRRNISVCLHVEFDPHTALVFIEKWLLPAINACPVDLAQDIANAARLLEGLPFGRSFEAEPEGSDKAADTNWSQTLLGIALRKKIESCGPPWLKGAANQLRRARAALGPNFFRVHPKGHGSVLLSPRVDANRLVTFYRGELYPSWRWGEKMDAIALTQQRKQLKPALPDFYNMALERPQTDPRGYGMLFVDASRKAGHGSSLSHSCYPTCEVRVSAKNGELCLAMTTLRELEMGEELTFDYHAVTESLNEYRSAVCLCGHSRCRGSFLHFATADCYQQVLNRNAPIATRFSNLVKGSMKQVMSEDDNGVLKNHGFRTAAFGAISVNRREVSVCDGNSDLVDSLDIVPVWLRTYVADTLRYIEYERRALPISLICDHLSSSKQKESSPEDSQQLKKPGLEPAFFFFSRVQRDFLLSLLNKEGFPESANGLERKHALQKVASAYWQELDEDKKQYWKDQANDEYEKKLKAWLSGQKQQKKPNLSKGKKPAKKGDSKAKPEISDVLVSSKMSFQDADAEGVSAMEQRIQQLTQTLSRVGRVLDRHREGVLEPASGMREASDNYESQALRNLAHPPLSVLPDEDFVGWIWNSHEGIVPTLFRNIECAPYVRPDLIQKLTRTKENYFLLERFGDPTKKSEAIDNPLGGKEGRLQLKNALLDFRKDIMGELRDMGREFRRFRAESKSKPDAETEEGAATVMEDGEEKKEEESQTATGSLAVAEDRGQAPYPERTDNTDEVRAVLDDLVERVVDRNVNGEAVPSASATAEPRNRATGQNVQPSKAPKKKVLTFESDPWLQHYSQRFTLQVAADVLLLYAHTDNFFVVNPYRALESTPVDVYARELGNSVPRTVIDDVLVSDSPTRSGNPGDALASKADKDTTSRSPAHLGEQLKGSRVSDELCQPDDIVASVSVNYEGDYVLSQLLQWYNGGIGQKPGIPDLLGCAALPSMQGCFSSSLLEKSKLKPEKRTAYEHKIRPRLVEWLQDPYQRGNPLPEEIRIAFESGEDRLRRASSEILPFGSPIIDFLVTGDESSIHDVLDALDADDKVAAKKKSDALLSSVDKGRPAQAVSTWVQCENPDCLKWRKIPWHVDIDLLPDKFFCENNIWNPAANFCGAPEDDWDQDDKMVDSGGKVEGSPVRKRKTDSLSPQKEKNFFRGARYDVLRQGKKKYCTGVVSKVDFSGKVKRILFHFPKLKDTFDEWVEYGSDRIARLNTKAPPPGSKGEKKQKKKPDDKPPPGPKGEKKQKKKPDDKQLQSTSMGDEKTTGGEVPSRPDGKKLLPAKRKKAEKVSKKKKAKKEVSFQKNGMPFPVVQTEGTDSKVSVRNNETAAKRQQGMEAFDSVFGGNPSVKASPKPFNGGHGDHTTESIVAAKRQQEIEAFDSVVGGNPSVKASPKQLFNGGHGDLTTESIIGALHTTSRLEPNMGNIRGFPTQQPDRSKASVFHFDDRDQAGRMLYVASGGSNPVKLVPATNASGAAQVSQAYSVAGYGIGGPYDADYSFIRPQDAMKTSLGAQFQPPMFPSASFMASSSPNNGIRVGQNGFMVSSSPNNGIRVGQNRFFMASSSPNNGISAAQNGFMASTSPTNGISAAQNGFPPTAFTAQDHATAYDLLLLSSVTGNVASRPTPSLMGQMDRTFGNPLHPPPGLPYSGASNASLGFQRASAETADLPQPNQQHPLWPSRAIYGRNPFNS